MTSLTYNVGAGRLRDSALTDRLNKGENPNKVAKEEMPKFNEAKGSQSKGLESRREKEIKHFSTPDNESGAKK